MSAGSTIIPVRINPLLLDRVKVALDKRNLNTAREHWCLSEFIRAAIEEKLAHMERSRRPKSRKAKEVSYEG